MVVFERKIDPGLARLRPFERTSSRAVRLGTAASLAVGAVVAAHAVKSIAEDGIVGWLSSDATRLRAVSAAT